MSSPADPKLPCAMLIKFHNFSDDQRVMEAVRLKNEMLFEGGKIYFFQDLKQIFFTVYSF